MIPWAAILSFHGLLILIVGSALLYGFALRRLAEFAEPYRFRLAELGEKYLAICRDKEERAQVSFYLDQAINPRIMIYVALLLPFLVIYLAIFSLKSKNESHHDYATYNKIEWLFTFSSLAANPIFGAIAAIEYVAVAFVAIVLAGNIVILRRAISLLLQREVGRYAHSAPS